jgi:hypothetical protein
MLSSRLRGPSIPRSCIVILAFTFLAISGARGQDFQPFDSTGLPGSQGVVVRVSHPPHWKRAVVDDPMALAELRGSHGKLTGILQIGRGRPRADMASLCKPERARTMLQRLGGAESDARVTDVFARQHEGRPAFEIRYERNRALDFALIRSVIVCLKDTQLVVSCGGEARVKAALAGIEPVCRQVLESLTISEQ